jgi:hypothetical protein
MRIPNSLSHITEEQIRQAISKIDSEGIEGKYLKNQYWVVSNGIEYPFKYLIRIAHSLTPGHGDEWLDFPSTRRFRNYIQNLGFEIKYYKEWINFFTPQELNVFQTTFGTKYKKGNNRDRVLGLKILPLLYKTETWARLLNIQGFEIQPDFKWQISGHFKGYTWARIFRKGDKDRRIFFTVGVNSPNRELVYKLDCLWSQTNKAKALSPDKVDRFRKYLQGTHTDWVRIPKERLPDYNWDRLIIESKRFIENNIQLYDDVIAYVWEKKPVLTAKNDSNKLRQKRVPISKLRKLPDRKPKFKGTKRDFFKESQRNKTFGDAGEQLVIKHEQNLLIESGYPRLADQIRKVADGKGYDILSYFPDKREKHIEVKTTTSGALRPFPISWNEVEYMKQPKAAYFLYRLYNYDPQTNSANFFILDQQVLNKLLLREVGYEAFIKSVD